jgi:adenine/guanine phosphoribosyltransferase-like PRPP-binding protein
VTASYEDRIIAPAAMPSRPPLPYRDRYVLDLPDGDWVELPLLALPYGQHAIVSLCITENSFELEERLSSAMVELARPLRPEVIVGMPTLGLVFAASVAKKLGHHHYVPLSYSRKFWFDDALSVEVNSITSSSQSKPVYIDPRIVNRLHGRRVVLVEDVISTGTTIAAQITLMYGLRSHAPHVRTARNDAGSAKSSSWGICTSTMQVACVISLAVKCTCIAKNWWQPKRSSITESSMTR